MHEDGEVGRNYRPWWRFFMYPKCSGNPLRGFQQERHLMQFENTNGENIFSTCFFIIIILNNLKTVFAFCVQFSVVFFCVCEVVDKVVLLFSREGPV